MHPYGAFFEFTTSDETFMLGWLPAQPTIRVPMHPQICSGVFRLGLCSLRVCPILQL